MATTMGWAARLPGSGSGHLRRLALAAAGLPVALASPAAGAYTGAKWNLPEGVTEISHTVHDLHMMMFWVCVVIGIGVFGAMFYSVYAHRKSRGAKAADFHESTLVEILWTGVPFLILIAVAIPAAAALIRMDDTRGAEMTVKITGYQWKWHYDYLGENVSFFSTLDRESNAARQLGSGVDPNTVENYLVNVDHPLVLPVGEKIRLLLTSNDVIHAWWVSELAVKKDAIPGYVNEMWTRIDQPGTFRGVCAELCGRDHGFMPIVVKAVPQDEFKAWLAEQGGAVAAVAEADTGVASDAGSAPAAPDAAMDAAPASGASPEAGSSPASDNAAAPDAAAAPAADQPKAQLVAAGEKVYTANCVACHQASGQGLPPAFPSLVTSAKVQGPPHDQIMQVLQGKNAMPAFSYLSDADIAAAITYTRNAWGHDAGVVQPAQVAAAR